MFGDMRCTYHISRHALSWSSERVMCRHMLTLL